MAGLIDKAKQFVSDAVASMEKPEATVKDVDLKGVCLSSVTYSAKMSSRNPFKAQNSLLFFPRTTHLHQWCLNELLKIMECQKMNEQTIYPVSYDVDPSEVRKQHGLVGEALAVHKNELKVVKWKEALREAANMSGWDLRKTADGYFLHDVSAIFFPFL